MVRMRHSFLLQMLCHPVDNCSESQSQYYLFQKDLNMARELGGMLWVFIMSHSS